MSFRFEIKLLTSSEHEILSEKGMVVIAPDGNNEKAFTENYVNKGPGNQFQLLSVKESL